MRKQFPEEIINFKDISRYYDIYFVDLWGVIHNGVKLFDNAIHVLEKLKSNRKKIVLISNAPRTNETVKKFLLKLNFDLDLIDLLITSGDVTRKYILNNKDKKFFHLGPDKDSDLFFEIKNITKNIDDAEEVVCTGLIDKIGQDIPNYENFFMNLINNNKSFLCANPDEVVSRGDKIEFCAGALAKYYKKLGGKVKYFGKPYETIYEFAINQISRILDIEIEKNRILAIGDNLKTDICGAQNNYIDSLLILNGIYKDFFRNNNLNFDKLLKSNEIESLQINKFQQELKW